MKFPCRYKDFLLRDRFVALRQILINFYNDFSKKDEFVTVNLIIIYDFSIYVHCDCSMFTTKFISVYCSGVTARIFSFLVDKRESTEQIKLLLNTCPYLQKQSLRGSQKFRKIHRKTPVQSPFQA